HTIVILRVKNEMDRNTAIQSQIEPDPDQKGTQNQHYGVVGIHVKVLNCLKKVDPGHTRDQY
ncbi:hypothetical protein ACJX0J_027727, partial [Zea mays]